MLGQFLVECAGVLVETPTRRLKCRLSCRLNIFIVNIAISRPTFASLHWIEDVAKISTAGLHNIIKKMEAA